MANGLPDDIVFPDAAPAAPAAPSDVVWTGDDHPEAKPATFASKAIEPITSYPEAYRQHREGSVEMAKSGLQGLWDNVPKHLWTANENAEPNPIKALGKDALNLGKVLAGSIGYLYSPVSAGLHTVVGKPIEDVTGSPLAGQLAETAAGLPIPGYGLTKTNIARYAVPSVPAPVVDAVASARAAAERSRLADANRAKAAQFTDAQGRPMELSYGEAAQDRDAFHLEDMAEQGAYGKPAQEVATPIQRERFDVMHGAADELGQELGGRRPDVTNIHDAARVVNDEMAAHAERIRQNRQLLHEYANSQEQAQVEGLANQEREIGDLARGRGEEVGGARDTGELVGNAVRERAGQARTGVNQAYERAFELPGEIHAGAFEGVGTRIKNDLSSRGEPVVVDDVTTPIASRALQHIDKSVDQLKIQNRAQPGGAPNPENIVAVNLRGVDQLRKQLNQFYASARGGQNPSDARAMGQIIHAFDDQVEAAVAGNLFSGDPRALQALQDARAAYRSYTQTFRPQGSGDDVGNAMRRIIDRGATPEEVANMVLGSSATGNAGLPVRLAARLEQIFGRESQEWSAVRQSLWQRASRGAANAEKQAQRIEQFANSTLGRQVFRPEELAAMRNHAQGVRTLEQTLSTLPARQQAQRFAQGYERFFGSRDNIVGGSPGQTLRKIAEGTAQPEDITKTIFAMIGSGRSGEASRAVDAIANIAGHDSPAFDMLRYGSWKAVTDAIAAGMNKPGAQKLSENVLKFVGSPVAKKLYSADELKRMREYAEVVKLKVAPPKSKTNPSGSAVSLATMARRVLTTKIVPTATHSVAALIGHGWMSVPAHAAAHSVNLKAAKFGTAAEEAAQAAKVRKSLAGKAPDEPKGPKPRNDFLGEFEPPESRFTQPGAKRGRSGMSPDEAPPQRGPLRLTVGPRAGAAAANAFQNEQTPERAGGGGVMSLAEGGTPDDADEAQSAAEAAAARVRAPYARAEARESGLPSLLEHYGSKVKDVLTAPQDALEGRLQVNDPETNMPTPEAMRRGADVAGVAMLGGMPMAEPGALGMFGGRLAATADREALGRAEQMAAQGKSREEIWHDTGWFQGKDEKWRFEIPDAGASIASPTLGGRWNTAIDHPDYFAAYPQTGRKHVTAMAGDPSGVYGGDFMRVTAHNQDELNASALHEMQHAVQHEEGFAWGAMPDKLGLTDKQVTQIAKNALPNWSKLSKDERATAVDQIKYIIYKQHAGEVEARNVETRRNMTPEERRANPPWTTEDVPPESQIVKFGPSATQKHVGKVTEAAAEHPAWINTRLVTSKKAVPTEEPQIVGLDAMKQAPEAYNANTNLVKSYPNMPEGIAAAPTDEAAEHFINHAKDNLLWLHDQVPENVRDRSSMWYEGGRKIIDDWSKQYGLKDSSVAGAIAALSPQKDWYQNVSLAKRVIETNLEKRNVVTTPEMEQTFLSRPALNKPEYQPFMEMIKGRTLDDINRFSLPEDEKAVVKALWTRLYDESHNSKAFPLVTPEGGFGPNVTTKGGADAGVGWGSLTEVSKAIRAIEGSGDKETMSALMGEKHKVRNFYNNLLSPNSSRGDVTIDTHAVAAGLLRPLSGTSPEVAHNFSNSLAKQHQPPGWQASRGSALTGTHGTYPLYAEAYRRAAQERDILPRQMQSITWEAVRGLFPENMKNAKFSTLMDGIWNDYRTGKATLDETRQRILGAAGGIRPPSWYRPAGEAHAAPAHTGDARKLPGAGVPRKTAGKAERGRGVEPPPGLEGNLGDLTRASGGRVSLRTRRESNYSPSRGTPDHHCGPDRKWPEGFCAKFRGPHACAEVGGFIAARGGCDWYERAPQARASGGRVLGHYVDLDPTEAQKAAGNYRKAHMTLHGLGIAIENPKGSARHGVGDDGKPWTARMPAHYGYIKGFIGRDKDHVDVYVGPYTKSKRAWVVEQHDEKNGRFDEHKVFLGFGSEGHVRKTYAAGFSDGRAKERLGRIHEVSVDQLKQWLHTLRYKKAS